MKLEERLKQVRIYLGKCYRVFLNDKGWKIFISAAIITLIISCVTSSEMFNEFSSTRSGAFTLVCACIWIGLFNSIQSICKERDILKREHRSGLHMSSYIAAHGIFEMSLCVIESIIVLVIIWLTNLEYFPRDGVALPAFIELIITFFLIIFSSDALGIMVSSIVKTPNTAMTIMPFVLIVQLVLANMIFVLEGFSKKLSYLTISKWGLSAIACTTDINSKFGFDPLFACDYEYNFGYLLKIWFLLIGFAVLYCVIGAVVLQFIDKDKR